MIANPAAAVSGLRNGIAEGLGVLSSAVEIKRTVPDLLGGRRLAAGRRLDATLTVDFDVAAADSAVGARVDLLTSGDSSVVASLTSEVQSSLAAQNIEVTIMSIAATPGGADAGTATAEATKCDQAALILEVAGRIVTSPAMEDGAKEIISCTGGQGCLEGCRLAGEPKKSSALSAAPFRLCQHRI